MISRRKYGTVRANPDAQEANFNREAKDWELPYYNNKGDAEAMVAARSVVSIEYELPGEAVQTITLASPVGTSNIDDDLGSAIYNAIKKYEFDVKIVATWAADVLNFDHWGQAKITQLNLDSGNIAIASTVHQF